MSFVSFRNDEMREESGYPQVSCVAHGEGHEGMQGVLEKGQLANEDSSVYYHLCRLCLYGN